MYNNFAYHIFGHNYFGHNYFGHNYFVEDGNEQFNLIERNLGVWTLRMFAALASDAKPATFWMSSANNLWRDNVAAGSELIGFWFELPGNPGGPSFTTSICPVHSYFGEFRDNIAHSNAGPGMRIYPHYEPLVDPCNDNSPTSPQYLYNFTSFRNGGNGIFSKLVGDVHHINTKLLENGGEEIKWVKYPAPYTINPNIVNMLCVGHTNPNVRVSKVGLWTPQNENFTSQACALSTTGTFAIVGCVDCDVVAFLSNTVTL